MKSGIEPDFMRFFSAGNLRYAQAFRVSFNEISLIVGDQILAPAVQMSTKVTKSLISARC
jgi:hypothetical protein